MRAQRIAALAQKLRARGSGDATPDGGWTALLQATLCGQLEVMRLLLAHPGVGVNDAFDEGYTALQVACGKGNPEAVALIQYTSGSTSAPSSGNASPLSR